MATPDQLAAQIQFALEQLSTRNGHHDFEELCRHLVGGRICSNVVPATGPVSSGGDQGRDFETFRSYLLEELGQHGAFLGRVSDEALAFACTLQKQNLPGKIRSDVETIVASGTPVARIYVFLGGGTVPVASRHELQAEIMTKHGVHLEVMDRVAIAEMLAQPDLFWIAERYLAMPAELAPPQPEASEAIPQWYVDSRAKWRERAHPEQTIGDLLDLKGGLRHATFHREVRGDLPFWLALATELSGDSVPRPVRQRARYEVGVATIRAQGDLRPIDDMIRAFFADSVDETEPARLEDASVLLMFVSGAVMSGASDIQAETVIQWNRDLQARITDLLAEEPPPNARAALLHVLGHLNVHPDLGALPLSEERGRYPDVIEMVDADGVFTPPPLEPGLRPPLVSYDAAMAAWLELARTLEQAPLFEVESFADVLEVMVPILVDEPGWRELVDRVDDAVERFSGRAAVAARCRDRAAKLLTAGRLRDALHEVHQAKVDWFAGDTLRGSILASLVIAQTYQRLNLPYAGKYYALAAAYGAMAPGNDPVVDLAPSALALAADCDYIAGAWCGATALNDLAVRAAARYLEGGRLPDDDVTRIVVTQGMALLVARDHFPTTYTALRAVLDENGLLGFFDVEDFDALEPVPVEEWILRTDDQISGRPFADLGRERVIRFGALGTEWTVRSSVDRETSVAAERFAAIAQIVLVELADDDLCLLRSRIDLTIELGDESTTGDERVESIPSNDGRRWIARLSASSVELGELQQEALTVLSSILLDASLLKPADYFKAIEGAFARGLMHKIAYARPYDELAALVSTSVLDRLRDDDVDNPFMTDLAETHEHAELAWQSGPGPGYTPQEGAELAAGRYQNTREMIPATIAMLQRDPEFQDVVVQLRAEGWRDWHLLLGVVNVLLTARTRQIPVRSANAAHAQMKAAMDDPEPGGVPVVPASAFTAEALREALRFSQLSTLQQSGLTLRQKTPDFPAINDFLKHRYGYWSDDAEHEPVF